jgi:hypothetical protein
LKKKPKGEGSASGAMNDAPGAEHACGGAAQAAATTVAGAASAATGAASGFEATGVVFLAADGLCVEVQQVGDLDWWGIYVTIRQKRITPVLVD